MLLSQVKGRVTALMCSEFDISKCHRRFILVELVKKGIQKSKCFILSVPIGKEWLNNVIVANNPNEKHQAVWELEDLENIHKEVATDYYAPVLCEWSNNKGKGCIAIWKRK